MNQNSNSKNFSYTIIAIVFFVLGALSLLAYQNYQNKNIQANSVVDYLDDAEKIEDVSATSDWIPYPTVTPIGQIYKEYVVSPKTAPSGKFTIVETEKITADRPSAETGEAVNYTVTIKNKGEEKKFLTHICFNHSGGVTFGCVLNKNLYPDEQFNVNNSMMYKNPGTYSVWITWSQDKTNFYRPVGAGTAVVRVN